MMGQSCPSDRALGAFVYTAATFIYSVRTFLCFAPKTYHFFRFIEHIAQLVVTSVKESYRFCSFLEMYSPKIPSFPLAHSPFPNRSAIFSLQNCI